MRKIMILLALMALSGCATICPQCPPCPKESAFFYVKMPGCYPGPLMMEKGFFDNKGNWKTEKEYQEWVEEQMEKWRQQQLHQRTF